MYVLTSDFVVAKTTGSLWVAKHKNGIVCSLNVRRHWWRHVIGRKSIHIEFIDNPTDIVYENKTYFAKYSLPTNLLPNKSCCSRLTLCNQLFSWYFFLSATSNLWLWVSVLCPSDFLMAWPFATSTTVMILFVAAWTGMLTVCCLVHLSNKTMSCQWVVMGVDLCQSLYVLGHLCVVHCTQT